MTGQTEPTQAAGGIVVRTAGMEVQVLLVHRPRYDDWSLPKGHVDPGESALAAAVREVLEETGYVCDPGDLAGIASYTTAGGEHKVVHYWLMSVVDGGFSPNDEVDQVEWVTPDRAVDRLSYDLDRDLIRTTLGTTP